ncbi:MAG: class I SAM-dependent methyltransferase [Prochloraceae cyanobacterium]
MIRPLNLVLSIFKVIDLSGLFVRFFFEPIFSVWIGSDKLQFYQTLDWQSEAARFENRNLSYPDYYKNENFHGIDRGYLNEIAAITYDAVTSLACPPNETKIRQQLMSEIISQPKRILDLGCGTGTSTLMLKEAYPQAKVIGLDLSPYMLVVADYKAKLAGLEIELQHGLAEDTGFEAASFDLITISMLLHETPTHISELIIQECFRLLKPRGQLIILDGNQTKLSRADWLIKIFQEPYSQVYAAGNVDDWAIQNGFENTGTKYVGWIHQVSQSTKPNISE